MWGSWGIAKCIILLGTRCRWVVNFMPWLFYALGKSLCYPLNRRMGDPKRVCMVWRREKSSTRVRNWSMIPSLSSMYLIHYTNWATPALLCIFCLLCHPSYRLMFYVCLDTYFKGRIWKSEDRNNFPYIAHPFLSIFFFSKRRI